MFQSTLDRNVRQLAPFELRARNEFLDAVKIIFFFFKKKFNFSLKYKDERLILSFVSFHTLHGPKMLRLFVCKNSLDGISYQKCRIQPTTAELSIYNNI